MKQWLWYLNLWKNFPGLLGILFLFTIVSAAVSVAFPMFFKLLLDSLSQNLTTENPDFSVSTFVIAAIVVGGVKFMVSFYPHCRAYGNLLLENRVRTLYFSYILDKEPDFFQKFRTGDLVTRLTEDLSGHPKVAWFGCSGIFRAINSLGIVGSCSAMMIYLSPELAMISLLPLPLAVITFVFLKEALNRGYEEIQKCISHTNNHLEMCFSGVRVLKACLGEERESRRFTSVLQDRIYSELEMTRLSTRMNLFYEFVSQLAQVIVVVAGGFMVLQQEITVGIYFAFFSYLSMIVYPMLDIPFLLVHSSQAFVCVDRLEEIRLSHRSERLPEAVSSGKISSLGLDSVSYTWPSVGNADKSQAHLSDLTLRIRESERVAIMGKIGSGKSTLLNLLAGVIRPDSGTMLLNDTPVNQEGLSLLRQKMGYIGQEPLVLSGTINQNVKFLRNYDQEAIREAARQSQFLPDVKKFSDGFEQEIGQRGVSISGGQKQRLTIARALISRPEILLMDDVTASLDAENEDKFWTEVEMLPYKPMMVIVTHRQATAKRANRVIMLQDGRIKAEGPFEELRAKSSEFRALLEEESRGEA